MSEPIFDHDRIDVYRVSIDYVARPFESRRNEMVSIVTRAICGCGLPNQCR